MGCTGIKHWHSCVGAGGCDCLFANNCAWCCAALAVEINSRSQCHQPPHAAWHIGIDPLRTFLMSASPPTSNIGRIPWFPLKYVRKPVWGVAFTRSSCVRCSSSGCGALWLITYGTVLNSADSKLHCLTGGFPTAVQAVHVNLHEEQEHSHIRFASACHTVLSSASSRWDSTDLCFFIHSVA
jgi:hypothetical protein